MGIMPEDEWGGGARTFPKSGARLGYEHLVLKPLNLGNAHSDPGEALHYG